MRSTELFGLPIMSIREGNVQGTVLDAIIDSDSRRITHYILRKDSKYDLLILSAKDVNGAGSNYLIVPDAASVKRIYADPSRMETVARGFYLNEARVISDAGETVGEVTEFEFEPQSGELVNFTVDGGTAYPADTIMAMSGNTLFISEGPGTLPRQLPATEAPAPPARSGHAASPETPAAPVPRPEESRREIAAYAAQRKHVSVSEQEVPDRGASPGAGAITQKYFRNLLIGKTLGEDVVSDDGIFRMDKGTVITEWHMQLAEQHDAVPNLMKHIEPM